MASNPFHFSSKFVLDYCQGVMSLEKDLAPLFQQADVDVSKVKTNYGLSFEEMQRLDQSLAQRYNSCHLALFKQSPPAIALKVTADVLAQAKTIEEAITSLVEMMQAINSPIQPALSVFDGQATIRLHLLDQRSAVSASTFHFILALRLLKVLRIIRFLSNSTLPLTILRLSEPPLSPISAFVISHNVSAVYWNQKLNALSFPAQYLRLPSKIKGSTCLSFLTTNSDIFAAPQPDEENLVLRVRKWMWQQLEENHQLPSAKLAEQFMNCSFKTLSRRLENEHTSFRELKVGIVDQKAKELLTQTDTPVYDIAEQLGFSETASFCRSFRQHNQLSPNQFRENNQL